MWRPAVSTANPRQLIEAVSQRVAAWCRLCCKSRFVPVSKNSAGRRFGFRVRIWGTSSLHVKRTRDLGSAIERIRIGDWFGARFPGRRGAQAPQAEARLEEGGRRPGLPDHRRAMQQQAWASQVGAPVVLSAMLAHCLGGPTYSITSSVRASSVAGTSRPSALAVLRLMSNSTFTAWGRDFYRLLKERRALEKMRDLRSRHIRSKRDLAD